MVFDLAEGGGSRGAGEDDFPRLPGWRIPRPVVGVCALSGIGCGCKIRCWP